MLLLPAGAAAAVAVVTAAALPPLAAAATKIQPKPRLAAAVPLLPTAGCLLAAVDFVNNTAVLCVRECVCVHNY